MNFPFIELHCISKSFGWKTVLKDISLIVRSNECIAVYGKNGAGKTTLLKILALFMKPSSGKITFLDQPVNRSHAAYTNNIGYIGHPVFLYNDLTVLENLNFFASAYGIDNKSRRIEELLAQFGLASRRHELTRNLSRGQQQRLSIARSVIHDPRLLLLDEPYTGLDLEASEYLDNLIRTYHAEERTVIITTHQPRNGLPLANRMLFIDNGRISRDEQVFPDTITILQSNLQTQLSRS
jgi:heme exporter protein A